jgi:acetyl-CoA C-acetyltransferase
MERLVMTDVFVLDAARTARGKGKASGALHEVPPVELAATVLRALRSRNDLDAALVEEVALGCVEAHREQGGAIGRIAALHAGFPETVPGLQIGRFCSSGLDAVNSVAGQIGSGMIQLALAGGVESMSRVPMVSAGSAWWADPEIAFETNFISQGVGADLVATRRGYTRERLDSWAVQSQRRASEAQKNGAFDRSLVTVHDAMGLPLLEADELPRPAITVADLAKLKPSFADPKGGFDGVAQLRFPDVEQVLHLHHAGSSSGLADGAAAVLLGSADGARAAGLPPRARIRSWATVGGNTTLMFGGPLPASEKALARAGMTWDDVDLVEINEAFAVMPVWFCEHFDLDPEIVNVNGGAIALGHPLGATGAMLLGTVLDELERRDLQVGLVSLCVASGMGTTAIVERI